MGPKNLVRLVSIKYYGPYIIQVKVFFSVRTSEVFTGGLVCLSGVEGSSRGVKVFARGLHGFGVQFSQGDYL